MTGCVVGTPCPECGTPFGDPVYPGDKRASTGKNVSIGLSALSVAVAGLLMTALMPLVGAVVIARAVAEVMEAKKLDAKGLLSSRDRRRVRRARKMIYLSVVVGLVWMVAAVLVVSNP